MDHHPINPRNYAAAYYQNLVKVLGPLLPEKIQKLQIFLKIAKILNIEILKNIPLHQLTMPYQIIKPWRKFRGS